MLQWLLGRIGNRLRLHPRLGRWSLRMLPDIPLTIQIRGIGPFRIRLRRNRSYWLRDPLLLEQFPLAALEHWVRPGTTVYDVGANMGLYTRIFLNYLQAEHVVAFEPMKDNLKQLDVNLQLGGIRDRVTVVPCALSDADGENEFQVDDLSTASATLTVVTGGEAAAARKQYGFEPKTETVMCRKLDSLMGELNLPPPDVIKVDIEGAEALFLEGARACLAQHAPRLMIELHGVDKARAVYRVLKELGYACSARVSPRLCPAEYCHLDDGVIELARQPHDIHFLLASPNPADLPDRVGTFEPAPRPSAAAQTR